MVISGELNTLIDNVLKSMFTSKFLRGKKKTCCSQVCTTRPKKIDLNTDADFLLMYLSLIPQVGFWALRANFNLQPYVVCGSTLLKLP